LGLSSVRDEDGMQVFISVRDEDSMQGLILARSGDWVQVLTSVRGDKRDKNRILIHRGMMQDTGSQFSEG